MRRSHVTRDILDAIHACMGDLCRQYEFARTRGIPAANCNSITAQWVDAAPEFFGDCESLGGCREWRKTAGIRIVITRICMGPDQQMELDLAREDAEAACFDDHVDLIEECLLCNDWSQLRRDHFLSSIRLDGVTYDVEAEGGGYSAYFELTVVADECCD